MAVITARRPHNWRVSMNGNEVALSVSVIQELKAKGAPILGAIGILGCAHGVLKMSLQEDIDGDEFIFEWTGTPDKIASKVAAQPQEERL